MGWFSSPPRESLPLESVRASAKAALSTFVSEKLVRYPQNKDFFELGLARLVAGQMACESALKLMIDSPNDFRSLLDAINISPCLGLQRMFCAFQHMALHSECLMDFEQRNSWLYLVGEGACDMYSQPFPILGQLHACYMEKMRRTPTTEYSAMCALHELRDGASLQRLAVPITPHRPRDGLVLGCYVSDTSVHGAVNARQAAT